jgi:pheromone receptor transcription factor
MSDDSEERVGRRKINIEFIEDRSRRHITFSKRKTGLIKKATELATLTGAQVLLLIASETSHVYAFTTKKLMPVLNGKRGRTLIQECLTGQLPPEEMEGLEDGAVGAGDADDDGDDDGDEGGEPRLKIETAVAGGAKPPPAKRRKAAEANE